MPPQRVSFRGIPLYETIHRTKCFDCGMGLVDATEWHPYEACEVFKRTHDSREVWRELRRMYAHGDAPWLRNREMDRA